MSSDPATLIRVIRKALAQPILTDHPGCRATRSRRRCRFPVPITLGEVPALEVEKRLLTRHYRHPPR
jgi:hypothetical protein